LDQWFSAPFITQFTYTGPVCRFVSPLAIGHAFTVTLAIAGILGHIAVKSDPTLLSAEEAKEKLREIAKGFFFRRLRTEDGKRVERLLVKSPPNLGKTTQGLWPAELPKGSRGMTASSGMVQSFRYEGGSDE
jgi:hypothetical protein